VIAVVGVDLQNKVHVEEIRRGRWDALTIIEEMFSIQQRYQPELFTTEAGAIEKSLGPFLKAEMFERQIYINLNPLTPTKDKQSRARSLQARMRAGGVKFETDADWFPALQAEMLRFPKDINDDQVDALSWIGLTLDQLSLPQTDREIEDEYYQDLESTMPLGRSAVTGY
jgi:predicted phage terminase large subunit-like protein